MKTQTRIGLAIGLALALLSGLAPRAGAAVTASGGNYTNDIPGYRIHVFTNSATASNFVVSAASPGDTVQVLVVAGGGGGGCGWGGGGGGGAGGFRIFNTNVTANQSYPILVGAGGNGSASASGSDGGPSAFGSVTNTGGGGGGGANGGGAAGRPGGSGGGGSCVNGALGSGTAGLQGYDGGTGGAGSGCYAGAGGGGAFGLGSNGVSTVKGGDGGSGTNSSISGPVVGYAGGGGGGAQTPSVGSATAGSATHGGGAGGYNAVGANGTPNTGGGGGAGGSGFLSGGSGGSGIVVVRYAVPNAWTCSMPITFTNDTRLNTLTNFPALVIFDTSKVNYNQFQPNGQDLRFLDSNGAELRYEVESWNTSSNSYIWVQIPTMTAGCVITAYWGNASAALPSYRTNGTVWADGYIGVWHLPDGTPLTAQDSSPNVHHATAITTPTATTGMVGGGANFSQNDFINYGNVSDYNFEYVNPFTAEAWIYGGNTTAGDIVGKAMTASPYNGWYLVAMHRPEITGTAFELDLNSTAAGGNNWIGVSTPLNSIAPNNWYHVVATYSGNGAASGVKLYINGALQTMQTKSDTLGGNSIKATTAKFSIGSRDANATWNGGSGNAYAGKRDEVRVSTTVRSDNWVWATYANMAFPAAFSTCGAVSIANPSPYKLKMAFSNYTRAEVLTNFPVLVVFSNGLYGSFNYNTFTAPASGGDLRFMDSTETSYLDFEIEKWATNDASYVWVRVPQLSSNTTIYAKWGGTDTNLPACTTNGAVWTNGFESVWHFDESASPYKDSTLKHNATPGAAPTRTTSAMVCAAQSFGGSSYLTAGAVNLGDLFTLSAWVNVSSASSIQTILGTKIGGGTSDGMAFNVNTWNTTDKKLIFETGNGSSGTQAVTPIDLVTYSVWHHVVVAVNRASGVGNLYVDGVDCTSANSVNTTFGNNKTLYIGQFADNTFRFNGIMDELRVSTVARSTNWVWAEYINMNSNALFNGYSTVERAPRYKLPMTFTSYTRAEVLTNFPVLVTFSNGLYGTFNYNTFSAPASGGDLRFTDSTETNNLDFEIEKWDTNGASYAWVRVPQLSGSTTIYAKWGGADTNLPACTTNGAVWDSNFRGVWHLKTGAGVSTNDSTGNGKNGTNFGATGTNGVSDGAAYLNGSSSYISLGSFPGLGTSNRTFSLFYYMTTMPSGGHKMLTFPADDGSTDAGAIVFSYDAAGCGGSPWNGYVSYTSDLNQWQQVVATVSGSTVTVYKNGTLVGSTNNTGSVGANPIGVIGRYNANYGQYFDGRIDEVRAESVARSSNWVWAAYQTIGSNALFNGYGTVVDTAAGPQTPPQIQNQAPTGVGTNGATFNGNLLINGFENSAVYVAWGQTNGSVSGSWAATNRWPSGAWANGSSPSTNLALSANANYYYTFGATNSLTNVVASGYQYLITGEVTVQPTDPTGRVTLADTAAFTVYRPASCTNEALTVAYTLGGTAISGTHYTNSPAASGTNGTVTIPAGQTNAVVTVYPRSGAAPQQTVVMTLASNNYAIGSANSATCTLAAADLTLTANAYLNGSGQLTNATQGVLATKTSGSGTSADPYVFDVANMNLGSYTILGNTANNANQYSATWRVAGSVTGTGNFDSYTTANNTYGGNVRIEAGGTITVNRINTRATYNANAGSVYLWATGTVTVATYIDTRTAGSAAAGAVTIRSEGPVSGQGITISGSVNGDDGNAYGILTEAKIGGFAANSAGDVSLYCRTNVTLAAGISTRGFGWYYTDGAVLIRGDVTDSSARAGTVSIGGTGGIRTDSGKTGGNVTIRANALQLAGGINTTAYCYLTRTGYVDIDVLENASIGGSIDTRLLSRDFSQGSPGYVKIVARRTALLGMDAEGYSIRTWPGTLANQASSASVAGDADVTLTGVDTSTEIYDPANPTNCMTSSIYVAGKINTGRWLNNNAMGNVRITAVEVQLKGDVTNSLSQASPASVMAIRYGTNLYGIVTHLMENNVRWTGTPNPHNILYTLSPGTLSFTGDVPYAGKLITAVAGSIVNLSATNVTQTSATFRGNLTSAGTPTSAVSVVWGQTAGNLDHTNGWTAGTWGDNSFPSTNISPLTANTNYYYTFVAANAGGTVPAANTQYLITGPLTAVTGDGICGVSATDTASIAISRPGTCVAGPLTVNYALSGSGTGYVSASPASGFTLAAGQTGTNIVFTPVQPNSGAPVGVTLTLRPGTYPSDALASDSISVGTVVAPDVTLTGDVYIDAADSGKLKYVSGGAVVAVPWAGTTLDGVTYAYTYRFNNLNLGGYNVHGAINHNQSQASALFQVGGNVSGGGSFYFYAGVNNTYGGHVRIEAGGSIAVNGIDTHATYNYSAGSVYLWATGTVTVGTYIDTHAGYNGAGGAVTIRSEGPLSGQGITISGSVAGSDGGAYSILTEGGASGGLIGGAVSNYCQANVTLAAGICTRGGNVTIRGDYANAALRAGGVTVHGSIPTWVTSGTTIGYGSGNIAVLATNLVVDGNLLTYCQSYNQRGGGIRVDVTGEARFGGYLDTHTIFDGFTISSPGSVYVLARHTAINGTNATGHSILTKPSQTSGTFAGSQSGDGNITLTNVDTSISLYSPANPLQSDTSSLSVSGKVEAAYCGVANIQGDIYLSAVEVQLKDAIITSAGPNSDIAVHYGVTTYGIVTHLVENGTRWDGVASHAVSYGLATPVFYADVPYAGRVGRGTVFKFR